jgi:uncharacterized protein
MEEYYVYVYIDPRNFEEFYFGKGKGNRKNSHLSDSLDSKKTRRIAEIREDGQEPIIRVIAAGLTEYDALLIEKTLLWKLGRTLTNKSSGHYANKFRPKNTLHRLLQNFDYQAGIYYLNVGEGAHRDWDDNREYGFVSAGQGVRWRNQISRLQKGDVIAAYLSGCGYVGIGKVLDVAKMVNHAQDCQGRPLSSLKLRRPNIFDNSDSKTKSEYVVPVDWIRAVPKRQAKWASSKGIYSSQLVRASLEKQRATLDFLSQEFQLNIQELLLQE